MDQAYRAAALAELVDWVEALSGLVEEIAPSMAKMRLSRAREIQKLMRRLDGIEGRFTLRSRLLELDQLVCTPPTLSAHPEHPVEVFVADTESFMRWDGTRWVHSDRTIPCPLPNSP